MDITQPPHSERYPDLARMTENPDRNFLWRNAAVNCGEFTARDRGVNERMDNHAFHGDVGFADAARRDFTLSDTSPVVTRFGFRPIPFGEIGLYQDGSRQPGPSSTKSRGGMCGSESALSQSRSSAGLPPRPAAKQPNGHPMIGLLSDQPDDEP